MEHSNLATFVLVHSAWLGGWAWERVARPLEAHGHRVFAPDLPGHGQDRTPAAAVTMKAYVRAVTDILDGLAGPAILVGHSLGGIVISQAAEERPESVSALVYLCAFLLPSGASFITATSGVKGSMVLDNLVMAKDGASVTIAESVLHEAFAHDVPAGEFAKAQPLAVAEPTAPLKTPLVVTDQRWGRIPRYYVECLQDHAIPPSVQKAMYSAIPVQRVFSMDASHAPNFSAPEQLASHLMEVAAPSQTASARV
jgi:pimeloyl-ACP methyl ester carboxylesterase